MDLKTGDVVGGRFTLKELLGKGGYGTVWRARHADLDQDYALKVLNPEIAKSDEGRKRFLREVKASTSFVHQYAVQVREFGRDEKRGCLYFTMDMVPGDTLEDILKAEGPLDPGRVIRMVVQALSALEKAHQAGLVHRDLKPANLMLTVSSGGEEEVRVLDFGIAKAISSIGEDTDVVTLSTLR